MITAAADGSSLSNPGPSGWAWYVSDDCWAAGGWEHGTNNMGELMAVVDLLQQTAHAGESLLVLCDSQYAINCATKWIPGWKRKGWRKADGKPVLNVELLKALDAALAGRDVRFEWVKGHAGHSLNEAADARARAVATAYRDGAVPANGPGFGGGVSTDRETLFEVGAAEPELDLFSFAEPDPEPTPVAPTTAPGTAHEVVALEKELLTNEVRTNPVRLNELLHPDFVEHTSSGRIVVRARAVAGMEPLALTPQFDLLACTEVADGLVALRYRLRLGSRASLRFSLWQRVGNRWQVRFHQGTMTPGAN